MSSSSETEALRRIYDRISTTSNDKLANILEKLRKFVFEKYLLKEN